MSTTESSSFFDSLANAASDVVATVSTALGVAEAAPADTPDPPPAAAERQATRRAVAPPAEPAAAELDADEASVGFTAAVSAVESAFEGLFSRPAATTDTASSAADGEVATQTTADFLLDGDSADIGAAEVDFEAAPFSDPEEAVIGGFSEVSPADAVAEPDVFQRLTALAEAGASAVGDFLVESQERLDDAAELEAEGGARLPQTRSDDLTALGSDLDRDGIRDVDDTDRDSDGIADDVDLDDDNDLANDDVDDDDDNDGLSDVGDVIALRSNDDTVQQTLDQQALGGARSPNEVGTEIGITDAIFARSSDLDRDGIADNVDTDIDDDGLRNFEDDDNDNDGIPDEKDDDNDNDGFSEQEELEASRLVFSSAPTVQEAIDLRVERAAEPKRVILDTPQVVDNATRAAALASDFDGDGVKDDVDVDIDGDGIRNINDLDDDNDRTPDETDRDIDGDAFMDATEAATPSLLGGTDGDGLDEQAGGTRVVVKGAATSVDARDDSQLEATLGSDLDRDGERDAFDSDVDGDGLRNLFDLDDDNDGLLDVFDRDADGDGFNDRSEVGLIRSSVERGEGVTIRDDLADPVAGPPDEDLLDRVVREARDVARRAGSAVEKTLGTEELEDGFGVGAPRQADVGGNTFRDVVRIEDLRSAGAADLDGDGVANRLDDNIDGDLATNDRDIDDDNDGVADVDDADSDGDGLSDVSAHVIGGSGSDESD